MTLTIREAQQAKMVLTATITKALNTFSAQTGLRVDYVNVHSVRVFSYEETFTESHHYDVTVSISM